MTWTLHLAGTTKRTLPAADLPAKLPAIRPPQTHISADCDEQKQQVSAGIPLPQP